jgi:deoxyribonuclease-4
MDFKLGFHAGLKHLEELNLLKEGLNINFFQVFLQSPQSFKIGDWNSKKLKQISQDNEKNDIGLVIHASYLLNLCQPEGAGLNTALRILKSDMNNSIYLNAIGVVIHMGKNTKKLKINDEEALENYINNIKKLLNDTPKKSTLILETGAGQGNEIGTDIKTLGYIRKSLDKEEKKRVKFCIDTCHVFAAGYNIGTKKGAKEFINLIDKELGWKNVNVIHLNDSKVELGKKVDRHADIGTGEINNEGFKYLVNYFYKNKKPMVLETKHDKIALDEQLKRVKDMFS